MGKELVIKAELQSTLLRLLDNPHVGNIIDDASVFTRQTDMTPWAESPMDLTSESIVRKYSGREDWDAFCLAVAIERLTQKDGSSINRG